MSQNEAIAIIKKSVLKYFTLLLLFFAFICIIVNYLYGNEKIAQILSFSNNGDTDLSPNSPIGGKLAIIIDDFGSSKKGVVEMMAINEHLTFAIMPFLENSRNDAVTAHEKGFEVIAHLPQ